MTWLRCSIHSQSFETRVLLGPEVGGEGLPVRNAIEGEIVSCGDRFLMQESRVALCSYGHT